MRIPPSSVPAPVPVRIGRVPKLAPGLSERTVSTDETFARAIGIAAAKGVTRLSDITGLDRIGIPVFTAVVPKSDDVLSVYNGKGHLPIDARTGALMEAIERQTALYTQAEVFTGSWQDLRDSTTPALDPLLFNNPLREDYDAGKAYWWMRGYDLIADEAVLVPAGLAGFGPHFADHSPYRAYSSNGLASGNCLEEAICHALCELVERDAWTLAELRSRWLPMARREAAQNPTEADDCDAYPRIDLSAAGFPIAGLMEKYRRAGLHPIVRDISSDIGIACIIASVVDDCTPGVPQAHSGLGAHPNATIAVIRALTELAQSRAVDIQGVREDILAADAEPGEHERHTQRIRQVDRNHWMLRDEGRQFPFADVISVDRNDVADDIERILTGLKASAIERVVIVDFTEPGGFSVVRVIVPGLEGWIIDHGKLGNRALQFWKRHAAAAD